MFDVTRSDSFHAVEKWKVDLDSKVLLPDGRPIPCVLLGNKSDMDASMHASSNVELQSDHAGQRQGFLLSSHNLG